jgi:hypothetical protein
MPPTATKPNQTTQPENNCIEKKSKKHGGLSAHVYPDACEIKAWFKSPRAFIGGLAIALAGSLCDLEPAGFGVAAWSRLSHRASPEFWFRVSQFQNPVTSWPLLQFALPLVLNFNFFWDTFGLALQFYFPGLCR